MGKVVDPEPPADSIPRAVSMAWTDPCDVEVRTYCAGFGGVVWTLSLVHCGYVSRPGCLTWFDVMVPSEGVRRATR